MQAHMKTTQLLRSLLPPAIINQKKNIRQQNKTSESGSRTRLCPDLSSSNMNTETNESGRC